jgi:hypothetical protein
MKDFSPHELDDKIHGFMARKLNQFPELEEERYYIERSTPTRLAQTTQVHVFPLMKLRTQS